MVKICEGLTPQKLGVEDAWIRTWSFGSLRSQQVNIPEQSHSFKIISEKEVEDPSRTIAAKGLSADLRVPTCKGTSGQGPSFPGRRALQAWPRSSMKVSNATVHNYLLQHPIETPRLHEGFYHFAEGLHREVTHDWEAGRPVSGKTPIQPIAPDDAPSVSREPPARHNNRP